MTFAEMALIAAILVFISFLLRPVQRRLERILNQFFRNKMNTSQEQIIDVTPPRKKDKPNE